MNLARSLAFMAIIIVFLGIIYYVLSGSDKKTGTPLIKQDGQWCYSFNPAKEIKLGEKGNITTDNVDPVYALNIILAEDEGFMSSVPELYTSFSNETANALKKFQESYHLDITGKFDVETRSQINFLHGCKQALK